MSRLLEINDLRVHFPTRHGVVRAVDGLSYSVDEGEIVGIVGESGSGKSVGALSILQLTGGSPQAQRVTGDITFQDMDLLKLDEEGLQEVRGNRIGMIFQEPMSSLNPVLTVGRQMEEVLTLHLGMDRKQAAERSIDMLTRVGIPDAAGKLSSYPHQLSGGMCQRVMIALAICCNPKLVIADEPTSALDTTTQAAVMHVLKSLTREMGMAVIFITHNLGLVARYVDKVVVMYAGKVMETASVGDIFGNPAHPYTQGLLLSVPDLGDDVNETLVPVPGAMPNPLALPSGCVFSTRCPEVFERCRQHAPELISLGGSHKAACWLHAGAAG